MEKLENIDGDYTRKARRNPGTLQVLEANAHLDREKKDVRKELKPKP